MNRRSFLKGLGTMGALAAAAPLMKYLPKEQPMVLPPNDLLDGYYLTSDGTGHLYWSKPTGVMLDGVSLVEGDKILWINQTNQPNGHYEITSVSSNDFRPTRKQKRKMVA